MKTNHKQTKSVTKQKALDVKQKVSDGTKQTMTYTKQKMTSAKQEIIGAEFGKKSAFNIFSFSKLYFSYYIRTFDAILLTFIFPVLMLFMLGPVMPAQTLLPGMWLLPGMTTAFFFLPKSLVQWRNSSLIKRIGITPIKPWEFITSIALVSMALSTLGFFMMMGISAMINEWIPFFTTVSTTSPTGTEMVKNAFNWGEVNWLHTILGYFNIMILSLATAFLIGMFARTEGQAFGTGVTLYFIIGFLGGILLNFIIINNIDVLNYTSMIVPWTWVTKLYIVAASADTMFVLTPGGEEQDILSVIGLTKTEVLGAGYGIGIGLSALFFGVTVKFSSFGKVR